VFLARNQSPVTAVFRIIAIQNHFIPPRRGFKAVVRIGLMRMEIEGIKDRYINNGKRFINDLDDCLSEISQALPENQPLLKELKNFRDKQKNRFEKF